MGYEGNEGYINIVAQLCKSILILQLAETGVTIITFENNEVPMSVC